MPQPTPLSKFIFLVCLLGLFGDCHSTKSRIWNFTASPELPGGVEAAQGARSSFYPRAPATTEEVTCLAEVQVTASWTASSSNAAFRLKSQPMWSNRRGVGSASASRSVWVLIRLGDWNSGANWTRVASYTDLRERANELVAPWTWVGNRSQAALVSRGSGAGLSSLGELENRLQVGSRWLPSPKGLGCQASAHASRGHTAGHSTPSASTIGAPCLFDSIDQSGGVRDVGSVLDRSFSSGAGVHAAIRIIVPEIPPGIHLTPGEMLRHALYRPRIAGAWQWRGSRVLPGWRPWASPAARIVLPPAHWEQDGSAWGVGFDFAEAHSWPDVAGLVQRAGGGLPRVLNITAVVETAIATGTCAAALPQVVGHAVGASTRALPHPKSVSRRHAVSVLDPSAPLQPPVVAAAAGFWHIIVLLADGGIVGWGSGGYGVLGYGNTNNTGGVPDQLPWQNRRPRVPVGGRAIQVVTSDRHTLALLDDGGVIAWGSGMFGRLGYGSIDSVGDSPERLPANAGRVSVGGRVRAIAAGFDHSMALLEGSGSVVAWGRADNGRLGYGSESQVGSSSFTLPSTVGAVSVGGAVSQLSAGWGVSAAILRDTGAVVTWGSGWAGSLGRGSEDDVGDTALNLPSMAGPLDLGGTRISQVSVGGEHTISLLEGGGVLCWGVGFGGKLGYGNQDDVGSTTSNRPHQSQLVSVGGPAVQVAAGYDHSLAVLEDRTVVAWGSAELCQLGYGDMVPIGDNPLLLPWTAGTINLGGPVASVSAGSSHSAAVLEDGSVVTWGVGSSGQLGYGSLQNIGCSMQNLPVTMMESRVVISQGPGISSVPLGGPATFVTAGESHNLAIRADGTVIAWGSGDEGQLGNGGIANVGDDPSNLPFMAGAVRLGSQSAVAQLSCRGDHTLALLQSGDVLAWGKGSSGQLGYGSIASLGGELSSVPAALGAVSIGGIVVQVSAGKFHSLALLRGGQVKSWGLGDDGQLGHGSSSNIGDGPSTLPSDSSAVSIGGAVVQVSAGYTHSGALLQDGSIRLWGRGSSGRLGYGSTDSLGATAFTIPSAVGAVSVGAKVVQIALGERHTLALLEDGQVMAWGKGNLGALGYGTDTDVGDSPQSLPSSVGVVPVGDFVVEVSAGDGHSMALLESGSVVTWGRNDDGQLGIGSTVNIGNTPSTALSLERRHLNLGGHAVAVSAGDQFSLVLLEGGEVVAFGNAKLGVLGHGSAIDFIGDDPLELGPRSPELWRVGLTLPSCPIASASWLSPTRMHASGIPAFLRPTVELDASGAGSLGWSVPLSQLQQTGTIVNVAPAVLWPQSAEVLTGCVSATTVVDTTRRRSVCDVSAFERDAEFAILQPQVLLAQTCIISADGTVTSTVGDSSVDLLPSGGDGVSLCIHGDFRWAAVLETITDARYPIDATCNASEWQPTASVWMLGISATGLSEWERRVKGCSFQSLSLIKCSDLPPAHGNSSRLAVELRLTTPWLASSVRTISSIQSAAPVVSAVIPSTGLAVLGNSSLSDRAGARFTLVVQGSSFGVWPAAVPRVDIVGVGECIGVTRPIPDVRLECTAPPGTGHSLQVRVSSRGRSTLSGLQTTGYALPSIVAVNPPHVLAGSQNASMVINGFHLAIGRGEVAEIRVGGIPCASVVVLVPGLVLECLGLDAPAIWPSINTIEVIVDGQTSGQVSLLVQTVPAPSVDAVIVLGSGTADDSNPLRIVGTGFGLSDADIEAVMIGNESASCLLTNSVAGFIECAIPGAGVGNVPVRVVSATGLVSLASPTAMLQYARPVIDACLPSLLLAGSNGDWNLTIHGRGFGRPPLGAQALTSGPFAGGLLDDSHDLRIVVGGLQCANVVRFANTSTVVCLRPLAWPSPIDTAASGVWWPQIDDPVRVNVGGQSSERLSSAVIRLLDAPSIATIALANSSTLLPIDVLGGQNLLVRVSNLPPDAVASVTVQDSSGRQSMAELVMERSTATELCIISPQGVGQGAVVTVASHRGLSASGAYDYGMPVVTEAVPTYMLPGNRSDSVILRGSNLAVDAAIDVDRVVIGGIQCGTVSVITPGTELLCSGVDATDGWIDPLSPVVASIGGQSSAAVSVAVLQLVDAPRITAVTPQAVQPGVRITIAAANLGRQATDVMTIRMLGTRQAVCDQQVVWSEDSISCTIPADHPLWLLPPLTEEQVQAGATEQISVQLVNRHGLASQEWDLVPINRGGGRVPLSAIAAIKARRPVGDFASVQVQWAYPTMPLEDELRATTDALTADEFHIRILTHEPDPTAQSIAWVQDGTSQTASRVLTGTRISRSSSENLARSISHRQLTDLLQDGERAMSVEDADAAMWQLFRADLVVATRAPVWVVVAASNIHGTQWEFPAPAAVAVENCREAQYLQDSAVICEQCPAEAVCAGLRESNVTARPGFWRLSWSTQLGFATCRTSSSCLGVGAVDMIALAEQQQQDNSSTGDDGTSQTAAQGLRFLPEQALPGVRLSPLQSESCSTGCTGVLCDACSDGYFHPSGTRECVPCGGQGEAVLRSLGLGAVVLVVLGIALWKAGLGTTAEKIEQSRTTGGHTPVLVMKVMLTHAQTVSLVSGVELQWPQAVQSLFAAAETGSSVSAQSLSLPCLVGKLGALQMAGITIGAALLLVLYAFGLWACLTHRALRRATKATTHTDQQAHATSKSEGNSPVQETGSLASRSMRVSRLTGNSTLQSASPMAGRRPVSGSMQEERDELLVTDMSSAAITRVPPPRPRAGKLSIIIPTLPELTSDRALCSSTVSGAISGRALVDGAATPRPDSTVDGAATPRPDSTVDGAATPRPDSPEPLCSAATQAFVKEWWSSAAPALLVLGFLLHPSLSKSALSVLACQWLGTDDALDQADVSQLQSRLIADLDVRCDDAAVTPLRLLIALPVLLLFSLGLPVFSALVLFRQRNRLSEPAVIKAWGFLYRGFHRQKAYAWESVVMARKLALAVVTVALAAQGPAVQTWSGLMVIFAGLAAHAWVKPYESPAVNRLEMAALSVAATTLGLGLLIASSRLSPEVREAASVTIVLPNVVLLAAAIAVACSVCKAKVAKTVSKLKRSKSRATVVPLSDLSHETISPLQVKQQGNPLHTKAK